jgi:hypothetical protein
MISVAQGTELLGRTHAKMEIHTGIMHGLEQKFTAREVGGIVRMLVCITSRSKDLR